MQNKEPEIIENSNNGKIIELRINSAPLCYLNTDSATSSDYLFFLESVISALASDKASLDREAKENNKTVTHTYEAFATIKDPTNL
ncbi:hypothetical protein [Xenorhabdus sp. KK7.4]|uniref:hypothetical protein n=1 Tax=Xenorhabdus sp. KK7.4 TaxID=1851572 RepID=UPI000C053460|nr:hypothetical protein [Xenorhabdus sp. KK7.4]PHM51127.1 hypothetical protein Xekk_03957 [Xenorhabdus sp. KK7.4]